jgi:hypothetical protein
VFQYESNIPALQFWSLWEIMKLFKIHEFSGLVVNLTQFEHAMDIRRQQQPQARPNEEQIKLVTQYLENARRLAGEVGFHAAKSKASLSLSTVNYNTQQLDHSTLIAEMRNVRDMLMFDLWNHQYVKIDHQYLGYINNDNFFGESVSSAFASAVPDIREAGNCIAFGLGTAAVFHGMRAVEHGLRALCVHLGITRIRKSMKPGKKKYVAIAWAQWEKQLNAAESKANTKMEKLGPGKRKQELQQFYVPIFQDIRGFKDAFRNHVMHSREEFSPEQADAICAHAKRFMEQLATKVSGVPE